MNDNDSKNTNTNNINLNDIMGKFNELMNGNQIPDNIKDMLGNMMNQNNNSNFNTSNSTNTAHYQNSTVNSTNTSNSQSSTVNSNNIDMNTIFKIQNIMNSLNNDKENESRTNLLLSLKPYLKESRRNRVDQCLQLMKMEKVMEIINPLGGEQKNV